jgi:hypothetical protein
VPKCLSSCPREVAQLPHLRLSIITIGLLTPHSFTGETFYRRDMGHHAALRNNGTATQDDDGGPPRKRAVALLIIETAEKRLTASDGRPA